MIALSEHLSYYSTEPEGAACRPFNENAALPSAPRYRRINPIALTVSGRRQGMNTMRLKKLIIATLIMSAALAAGILAPKIAGARKTEQDGLTIKPGVLMVGIEIGYPPLEYYEADGITAAGFDVEMMRALGAALGLDVEFVDTAWDGIFAGVKAGRYDCMVPPTITPERLLTMNFTRPYIAAAITIVTGSHSPAKITRPQDIAGYRVTYQGETTADLYAARIARSGVKFEAYAYDKVMDCFDDVRLRRADLVIADSLVASASMHTHPGAFQIAWQGPADEQFGIALKKGNDALTAALNRALDELFADGTMRRLSEKYVHADLVTAMRPDLP
jgi:polar amino acid transport system substrate-binding protein